MARGIGAEVSRWVRSSAASRGLVGLHPRSSHTFRLEARRLLFGDVLQFVRSSRGAALRSLQLGLLSWGSSIAPSPRTPCCVHSRMEVSPSFGPGPACGSGRVPSLPFLPASTVCSAAGPTRVGSLAWRRFVAPCSRPGGSPCWRRRRRPSASDPKTRGDGPSPPPFPMASTLRSVLLSGSLAVVTARSSREELAFTDGRALSSLSRSRRAASPRCAGAGPRPQGFVPPESPFRPPDVSVGGRSMLPWALSAAARSPVARWLRRPQVTSKSESEDALSR